MVDFFFYKSCFSLRISCLLQMRRRKKKENKSEILECPLHNLVKFKDLFIVFLVYLQGLGTVSIRTFCTSRCGRLNSSAS